MLTYFISDLHVDFYIAKKMEYDRFYDDAFLPAERVCIAGDISNDFKTYVNFVNFICTKYKEVNIVLGNHDIITEKTKFKKSEVKIEALTSELSNLDNLNLITTTTKHQNINGCMGLTDWSYCPGPNNTVENNKRRWLYNWFDGRMWNYFDNDTNFLHSYFKNKLDVISKSEADIIMTHYIPLEFGIPEHYKKDSCTNFFYFEGKSYLDNMKDDSIWQAGHTHDALKKEYINSSGNKIQLLINPYGYPDEIPYDNNNLSKEDFLIEV
jgi:hypothetical protein